MPDGLILGLLNLPKNRDDGNSLSIDGIGFRTSNEFVVITGVPEAGIHWIVWNHKHAVCCHQDHLVLSYDPSTEELVKVDSVTFDNFLQNRESWVMRPGVVRYDALLQHQNVQPSSSRIDSRLLSLRGISHGTKIFPGTYNDDNDDDNLPTRGGGGANPKYIDGIEMVYPPIPVFYTRTPTNRHSRIRHISHGGTKSFLRGLSPAERTRYFLSDDDNPNTLALHRILSGSYENSITLLVADLELSFLLLTHIHCYSSWNHWRNLTVLLLRAHRPEICPVLLEQLPSIESELLYNDDDDSDGVFITSLREYQAPHPSIWKSMVHKWLPNLVDAEADPDDPIPFAIQTNEEDDDDLPVIVPNVPDNLPPLIASVQDPAIRQTYPILTAAVLETEDILMTCARALDEAKDVSLVREAAAYLEEVEAQR